MLTDVSLREHGLCVHVAGVGGEMHWRQSQSMCPGCLAAGKYGQD